MTLWIFKFYGNLEQKMVTPPQSGVQKLGLQMCFYAGIIFCCDSNFVGEKMRKKSLLQVVSSYKGQ